jgi:hypothetical protein
MCANSSAVRLAAERRRAGRPEGLEELLARKPGWHNAGLSAGGVLAEFARLALREGWHFQAVWHARRAARAGCPFTGLWIALAALRDARRCASPGFDQLLRLAGLGTVRAYRLRPVA